MILHRLRFLVLKNGKPTRLCLLIPFRLRRFIIRLYFAECKKLWNNNMSKIKEDMKTVTPTLERVKND